MKYFSDVAAFVLVVVFLVFAVIFTPIYSDNDILTGFVTHSLYPGYAVPLSSISVDTTLVFNNATDATSRLFEVTDDIIYRRGYVSYDGQSWQQFNLTYVSTATGEWINGRGLVNVAFNPAKLRLNATKTVSNNTYLIIYSCSKDTSIHDWNCHDGWQIIKFDARLNSASPVSSAPIITFISPTPSNGATITSSSQQIVATISDDSSAISSWIDFDKSLIGYWSMDQYSASGVYDNSTYKRTGTFQGGLGAGDLITAIRGRGITFDGISDRITVPTLDLSNTDKVTVSLWFKTSATTSGLDSQTMVEYGQDYNSNNAFIVEFGDQGGNGRINLADHSSSGYNLVYTSNTYNDGRWHHFVGTIDRSLGSSQNRIYIDGVLDTYQNPPHVADSNGRFSVQDLYIGGTYVSGYDFSGSLDEVMIFNRVLTTTEVKALYDSKTNKFDTTLYNLANGQHSYAVYAIDGSGNLATSSSRNFIVNSTVVCRSQSYLACSDNDVYWYNNCNARESKYSDCTSNQICSNNACVDSLEKPIKVFIIGDSTACNYPSSSYPLTGWGMRLQQFFDNQDVVVVNNALEGESSRSYLTTSLWTSTLNGMSQGDYLFIQFGHNDEPGHNASMITDPYTTYQDYLQTYIDAARAKGVYPVLLTPVERNMWSGTVLTNSHGNYPAAMIALAQEQDVPLIDMTSKTRTLYYSLGQAYLTNYFFTDAITHFTLLGANETAKLVISGITDLGSSSTPSALLPYIKGTTSLTCIPNARECVGTSGYRQCNSAGSGWVNTNCLSSQTCTNGACITTSTGTIEQADYYVATPENGGDDSNPGTFERPWATWQKAFNTVREGDLVYIRGGIYYPTATYEGGVYAGVVERENSGTASNPIRIFAYPGENPILDCKNVVGPGRRFGIYLGYVSYWHLKGLTVRNVPELTSLYASSSGISQSRVSHIIYEQCTVYNCGDGFSSNGFSDYCYWINCDAHDNVDTTAGGDYADGFKLTNYGSGGNTHLFLSGCRSWHNSDDGYDFLNADGNAKGGYVTIDNSWSFRNGHSGGNGVGFKMGGAINGVVDPGINRIVTGSIAWDNANSGFDENAQYNLPEFTGAKLNCIFYNNIAYHNNLANIMYVEGFDFNYIKDGARHIFKNNIAYANLYGNAATPDAYCTHDHNSWDTSNIYVTDADFLTLDDEGADGPRESDGSLPNIDFLKLRPGSDLIGAGVDVGLDDDGAGNLWKDKPSIGAYEYYP